QLAIAIDQAELYAQTRTAADLATAQAEQLKQALHDLQSYQAQLVQTEKMSTLGTLIAGVAHEINNPTSFIYGNLHYANEYIKDLIELVHLYQKHYPDPNPEIRSHSEAIELDFLIEDLPKILGSMETGAERIRHLVLSLRNFSRRDQSHMQPVNLHDGIESTLLILQNRLKANGDFPGIEVIKEYGELPPVECYPSQLNQVFMNLLGNAIDALDELRANSHLDIIPTIWISTEVSSSNQVTIQISDNGPGITEEAQLQLFDPFFTTKPVGKGTGLGLSISYQIVVEKHKGSLQCKSMLGKGTQFSIEIPIRQNSPCPVNISAPAEEVKV
ncbi:MAG TPA: ATP-binding protein, partial [Coleofasciculaceae cyanobacterium]